VNYPCGLIVDQNGDIYFADDLNFRVRKISQGTITTVAGNGTQGYTGDGGPATQAELNGQVGVALDPLGNLYIADSGNNAIRKVGSLGAATTPNFSAAGITNGASFKTGLTAGGLITIFGANLSNGVVGFASFNQVPLPTSLANSRVLINGSAIPLFYVVNIGGSEQISAQAPFEIAGQQNVSLSIDNGRVVSPAIQVPVLAAQPGIFLPDGVDGAFLHGADNSLVTAAKPASPGEVVVLYCTGLGAVTPPGTTGGLASGTQLSNTNITPAVTVGGTTANIGFSGLAPGLVGLYQINLTVPAGTSSGSANVIVVANGVSSNTARLPVQ
jgi:minor extracellular serine protease Vpr